MVYPGVEPLGQKSGALTTELPGHLVLGSIDKKVQGYINKEKYV
jgi:hypothetical protein